MSEYPIQFKDGTWGWRHALDEPDFSDLYEEWLEEQEEKRKK